jgi:flagellar motor component MotA
MKISTTFFSPRFAIVSFAFVAAGTATGTVSFQDEVQKPMTRKECVKQVNEKFSDPTASTHASKELLQMIKDLETETDTDKRKVLEEKKKVEMDKFWEKIDTMANKLCDRLIK